jgi:hypothetical protein
MSLLNDIFALRQMNDLRADGLWPTSVVPAPPSFIPMEFLIVAGGGAGGASGQSGGGGAGGLLYYGSNSTPKTPNGPAYQASLGTYTITVGAGGSGALRAGLAGSGQNSVISYNASAIYTALGGGRGGSYWEPESSGGSGGGGAANSGGVGGAGTTGQGNAGGNVGSTNAGGGGGGAGTTGSNGSNAGPGGNGGNGLTYDISGTSVAYAGGGGGASATLGTSGGSGGTGGGGSGGRNYQELESVSGTINTGGGGGGGAGGFNYPSASGGSGIVIIRYADSYPAATSTTGSPTVTVAGGFRTYRFTSSGSITF